ncbi:MAG TPA: hypothetical protein VI566_03395 [Xanthomonadales bacterium]|nr:hypothetical protein [Xanthomonadales bacterium]
MDTAEATQPAPLPNSIAVLPFANLSSDAEQGYFADGLSEEILNRLAQVQELQVAARTSSFYFKDKNMDISEIGEMLDVAFVAEGSVRRSRETMRITVQLNRTADGFHVWSKTYDRSPDDIFAVQDEISKDVTEALQVSLGVSKFSRMPGMTTNAMAYDAYLKGTKAFDFTTADITKSIEYLEQAVQLDPNFALAWNTLAGLYSQTMIILPDGFPDWQIKMIQALGKSFELAPHAPYNVANRVGNSLAMRDWVSAEKTVNETLESARQYGLYDEYMSLRATFLIFLGRCEEALAMVEQEQLKDPLSEGISSQLIELYHCTGDLESALAEADAGAEHGWVGLRRLGSAFVVALASGDRAEIEKRFAALPEAGQGAEDLNKRMVAILDDREAALAQLRENILQPDYQTPLAQSIIAIWAAYFGDPELSLQGLKASRGNIAVMLNNAWLALYSDVRKLPGFRELMTELGIATYWRTTGNWADACHPIAGGLAFECQ